MEELTQTIIEIPKFTLFIPTEKRPIHRIVLGTHRCRIVDIGDDAFPIEDGTLSFANGLNLFRVKGRYSQYDLLFKEQIPEEEIDKYDKDDSEIYYARKHWFSNKKVAYGDGWCKLKEKKGN